MLKWLAALLAFALGAAPLAAQTETALKEYFEGGTVSPKLAMPGTEDGIDIYPGSPRPLDYSKYASRLKKFGTAIKAGEPVTITKIRLKSKHIEFQLGGGGYGTFGDETSSNVGTAEAPKTKREQNLEADLKRETDPPKGERCGRSSMTCRPSASGRMLAIGPRLRKRKSIESKTSGRCGWRVDRASISAIRMRFPLRRLRPNRSWPP